MRAFPPGRGRLSILGHRLKMLCLEPFIEEHWLDGESLRTDIAAAGWIAQAKLDVRLWCGPHGRYPRARHEGFNVIYYRPSQDSFSRWKYGLDIVEGLIREFPHLNWIALDGTMDMSKIYPVTDLYVRPSRHDGFPRMVEECRVNCIPVLWSCDFAPRHEAFAGKIRELSEASEHADS